MLERELEVINAKGLHLRAASELVKLTSNMSCKVSLANETIEVDGKSILGVAALGAGKGCRITVRTDGEDEQSAIDQIQELFQRGFYENVS